MPPEARPQKALSPQLKAGLAITGVIVLLGLLAPWIAPHPWDTISMRTRFLAPNATYWLGTDEYGRDVLSRLLMGTRLSLVMGISATAVSLVVGVPIGTRVTLEGESVAARVHRTGRPARFDDYANASGNIAARARRVGVRSAVGTPIVVEGRLWGAMVALSRQAEPLPTEAASRIEQFTQLVATAISNTEARAEAARLAEEQAALRRVATLVARGASPAAVFEVVATEAAHVLDTDRMTVARYEPDGTATVVADRSKPGLEIPVGTRLTLEGESVTGAVLRSGRLVRRTAGKVRPAPWRRLPGRWACGWRSQSRSSSRAAFGDR